MQRDSELQRYTETLDDILRESQKRIEYFLGLICTWNLGQSYRSKTKAINESDEQLCTRASGEKIKKCIKLASDAKNALENLAVLLENENVSDAQCNTPGGEIQARLPKYELGNPELHTKIRSNIDTSCENDKKGVIDAKKAGIHSSDWIGSDDSEKTHKGTSSFEDYNDVEGSFLESTHHVVSSKVKLCRS